MWRPFLWLTSVLRSLINFTVFFKSLWSCSQWNSTLPALMYHSKSLLLEMNCYCLPFLPCSWWSVKCLKLSFCLCLRLWSTSVTWTALWFVSSYGEPSGTFASLTTSSGQLLSHCLITQKQNWHSSCQNRSVKQILTTSEFFHFVILA